MFYERLVTICAQKGTNPTAVCKALGFAESAAARWKQGSVPRDTTIKKIADYFGVPVSYLTGLVNDPDPLTFILPTEKNKESPLMKMLGEKMREMSAEELDELNRYVDYLVNRKK